VEDCRYVVPGLVLVLLVWIGTARTQEPQGGPVTGAAQATFLATWSQRLQALQGLHMVFTQTKQLKVLRQPLVARGELWLKGDRLRYTLKNTAGETELDLLMDTQTVRTYYPLLHTLEVIDLRTAGAPPVTLPFLRGGPGALSQAYEVELFRRAEQDILRLVPRDTNVPLHEMRLVLRDFQPQEVIQIEKNGTNVHMRIEEFTVNPEIPEARLALQIPPGTKVTHPLR
jgi:outer membrane lipoprotein-sorting protein